MRSKAISALILSALLLLGLSGCGSRPDPIPTPVETEPTVPPVTTPADGNPGDVTCQGSYTADNPAADTPVATVGDASLTNGQLQVYYWLAVAQYRQEDHDSNPDFSQPLDVQPCPMDDSVNSWQQYFLREALNRWHTQQALVLQSELEMLPTEEEYKPDLEKRKEYMTNMPAVQYLYGWNEHFQPNRLHQEYLDTLNDTLQSFAAEAGFGTTGAMASSIAGASEADLTACTQLANRAYMYFTELTYHMGVSDADAQNWYQAHSAEVTPEEKTVDIRHILLIPDNAEIAADGTVTASEDDWNRCLTKAKSVVDSWKKAVSRTRFAQFATVDVAETRFAEIAKDNSQDPGSSINGGLYVSLKQGQLLPELDAWCFDEARQHGDTEILRTDCGYHIVFFSKANEGWYTAARAGVIREYSRRAVEEATGKYPMSVNYPAIALGQVTDNGSFVTLSDLIYPDIAHQRYPDMMLYLQQDYPDAPYGKYLLRTHGCGITTLAMIATYLADEELTPVELAARYGYYCGERGSEICIFDDTPAEMGFYLKKRSYSWQEIDEALQNGQVVVSLQHYGYWTRGGHYLAMIGMTDDGKYVVRDSNLLNYKRIQNHTVDAHTRGSISEAGQYYWVYEKKITQIPTCIRCGEGQGAPEAMFREDYLCAKCRTAMERRGNFLNLAG